MLGALALGAFAPLASLATAAHGAPPTERQVRVVVAGPSEEADAMAMVVVELLGRLGVEATVAHVDRIDPATVITPRADGHHPVARAWIDLAGPERATVYVVDAPWERILTRHVARAPENDELTREELGHILETTVEAMLTGARIGVERVPSRRAASRMRAPHGERGAEPVPAIQAGALVGYEIATLGPSAPPSQGPLVALSLEAPRWTLRPGVWVSGQLRLPQRVEDDPIGLRLDSGALRLLAVGGWQIAPSLRLRFGAGGGVDITHIEPSAQDREARLTDARWLALPMFTGMVGPELRLGPWMSLMLAATCDIDPTDTRYGARQDGRPVEVLVPARVRPGLLFGVRVSGPAEGAR